MLTRRGANEPGSIRRNRTGFAKSTQVTPASIEFDPHHWRIRDAGPKFSSQSVSASGVCGGEAISREDKVLVVTTSILHLNGSVCQVPETRYNHRPIAVPLYHLSLKESVCELAAEEIVQK